MSTVSLNRRLINPGRRVGKSAVDFDQWDRVNRQGRQLNPRRRKRRHSPKRKLSLKQKLHFGTPAQRSAAKRALRGRRKNPARTRAKASTHPRRRRRTRNFGERLRSMLGATGETRKYGYTHRIRKRLKELVKRKPRRRKNVGEIVRFGLSNPSRKRRKKRSTLTMARKYHRRRKATTYSYRRKNTARRTHRRRRSNPSLRALLGLTRRKRRSSHRRRNMSHRKHHRRRNPGSLMTSATKVAGALGGAYLTAMLQGVIPAQFTSGIMGYIATAFVAYLQGYLVSRFAHKAELGNAMQLGGYIYLGLKILNDFAPSIANLSPFGLRGALALSSFYTPQVTQGNSFVQFATPRAVMSAMPSPSLRGRTGRTS